MKLNNHTCPLCGEKTLESQSEVVWCSNLRVGRGRSCQFGLGTGEKTFADLKKPEAPYVSTAAHQFAPGNFVSPGTENRVGVTRGIADPSDADPLVLVKWMDDLSEEMIRSQYLYRL